MKRRVLLGFVFILFSIIFFNVPCQAKRVRVSIATFPDATFRQYVSRKYDKNQDGYLSDKERNVVKKINMEISIDEVGTFVGIEKFTQLTSLSVFSSSLQYLDLSRNKKLKTVNLYVNNMEDLYIEGCKKISKLVVVSNRLLSLDLDSLTMLKTLSFSGSELDSLSVKKNKRLEKISITGSQINQLNLTKNRKLKSLELISNANITRLNLKKNTLLKSVDCRFGALSGIVFGKAKKLTTVTLTSNVLENLNLSSLSGLKELQCDRNNIYVLNVVANRKLQSLVCHRNNMDKLYVYKKMKKDAIYKDITTKVVFRKKP